MARKYLAAYSGGWNLDEMSFSEDGAPFSQRLDAGTFFTPPYHLPVDHVAWYGKGALLYGHDFLYKVESPDFVPTKILDPRVFQSPGVPGSYSTDLPGNPRVGVSNDGRIILLNGFTYADLGRATQISYNGGRTFQHVVNEVPVTDFNAGVAEDSFAQGTFTLLEDTGELLYTYNVIMSAIAYGFGHADTYNDFPCVFWNYENVGGAYVNRYQGGIPCDQADQAKANSAGRYFSIGMGDGWIEYPNRYDVLYPLADRASFIIPFQTPISFPWFVAAQHSGTLGEASMAKPNMVNLTLVSMKTRRVERVLAVKRLDYFSGSPWEIEGWWGLDGENASAFIANMNYLDGHFGGFIAVDLRLWQNANGVPLAKTENGDTTLILNQYGERTLKSVPLLNHGAKLPMLTPDLPLVVNHDGSIGSLPEKFLKVYNEGKANKWAMVLFGEDDRFWTNRVDCHEWEQA
jgi:hypothetical protein